MYTQLSGLFQVAHAPVLSLVGILMLTSCTPVQTQSSSSAPVTSPATSALSTTSIKTDGSSTVYPLTQAAVKAFQPTNPNVEIDLAFSGTTGGFRKFCAGETHISNASRPISTEEIVACRESGVRFVELPLAFDALTVVVHPQNTWATDLSVEELKRIWQPAAQGQITNWQQVRASFPNQPLKLYGPDQDSGTYDYFAEAIVGGDSTRTDYTASEDDTVLVQGIENDPNALGYFGLSYYEDSADKLKAVAVDDGQGKGAVLPSRETVENAQYQPLSRPLFVYINLEASQKNESLRNFVEFYLKNAEDLVLSVDYIPLPREAYDISKVHLYQGKVGTAYEGKPQPYLTIGEVLSKEQTF